MDRAKLERWFDRLLSVALVVALGLVGQKYLLPRGSDPLGALAGQPVLKPGPVTVVELAKTYCPACVVSKPIVAALGKAYAGRAEVKVVVIDDPAQAEEAARLSRLADLHVTPTFLVTDRQGKPVAKFIGPTSYAALKGALDAALAAPAKG